MKLIQFKAVISRFGKQGEKTGWTYIEIPADIAEQLKKNNRLSFRVKGKLDSHKVAGLALLPMGGGKFILTLNASLRKLVGKKVGAMIEVALQEDKAGFIFNKDFLACLDDEPEAAAHFKTLTGSHQRYFSKWIDDAKTEETRAKRIALAVSALAKRWGYPEMLRAETQRRRELGS
jgi:hypothetical protein